MEHQVLTELKHAFKEWEKDVLDIAAKDADAQEALIPPASVYIHMKQTKEQQTLAYVKQNPGHTQVEYVQMLGALGFAKTSVAPSLSRLINIGVLSRGADRRVSVTMPGAEPFKALHKDVKEKVLRGAYKKRVVKTKVQVIKTSPTVAAASTTTSKVAEPWDPEAVITALTVYQAKALYMSLKEIFTELPGMRVIQEKW